MAYGQPVRSVISVWCSALLPRGYTRLLFSPSPSFSAVIRSFLPVSFSLCLALSLVPHQREWWRTGRERKKKRDWSDGNPSTPYRGPRADSARRKCIRPFARRVVAADLFLLFPILLRPVCIARGRTLSVLRRDFNRASIACTPCDMTFITKDNVDVVT